MSGDTAGHREIEELLGAYALGAVGPDERNLVEEHLPTCPTCVIELASHVRVATAFLADSGLKQSLLAPSDEYAKRGRRALGCVAAVAAVAVLNVVLITAAARGEQRRVDGLSHEISQTQLVGQAAIALANPADHRIELLGANDRPAVTAVARPDGSALVVDSALPPLPPGKTYELWRVENLTLLPAAILGNRPQVTGFQIPAGTLLLAVTVEAAGGATTTHNLPVAEGRLG